NSVTRGWIIDPRRSQFGFDLEPFFYARRFARFFFRHELTRSDCLDDSSCLLPRDVDPTGLKSKRAETVSERFRCVFLVTCSGFLASGRLFWKTRHNFGICLVRVGLQPFQLRVAVDTTLASKEPSVEREHECVARACERH